MIDLDHRASILLKTLIERYSVEGQPIGSKTLSQYSGLALSPASVRHVMAELEGKGYIVSPHTSSGRIPTALGYRLFIDQMLTASEPDMPSQQLLEDQLKGASTISPQEIITQASGMLSSLTHFAGIVRIPKMTDRMIRHIEFVKLSGVKILIILVMTDGSVQNRVITTTEDYPENSLQSAATYFNSHYAGLDFSMMQAQLTDEINALRSDIATLMQATLQLGTHDEQKPETSYILSGQKNLLGLSDFSNNIHQLQQLFAFFEQKTTLSKILDDARQAEGVQIFIGGESNSDLLEGISVVAASYEVEGKIVGTLGVLGPTRMNYEKVIPIVDITAKLLSSALSLP